MFDETYFIMEQARFGKELADLATYLKHSDEFKPVAESRREAALPPAVRKTIVKTVSELRETFAAVRDSGSTCVWELFAGEHVVTKLSVEGGHHAGQPLELQLGIDLSDEHTVGQVLAMTEEFDPWLVTVGCDPWGPLTRINIARGFGGKVFAKRQAHWGFLGLTAELLKRPARKEAA